ncbi:MAG: AAA family ATPase, partial [Bdellovibrionales bacterium]|nr:AAA family ATPase [Bdellovibrionales bacterium]
FVGLDDIVRQRIGQKKLGFGVAKNEKLTDEQKKEEKAALLAQVQPEDLLKFGLIPEFIGRLPLIASLEDLDEAALVKVLSEPKNALTKQYKKLFELENVQLRFADGALNEIAKEAIKRKSGARGLRAIMESIMLDIMFEAPSDPDIKEIVISADTITKKELPLVVYQHQKESA